MSDRVSGLVAAIALTMAACVSSSAGTPPAGEEPGVATRTIGKTGPRVLDVGGGGGALTFRGGDGGSGDDSRAEQHGEQGNGVTFWIWTSGTRAVLPDFEGELWRDERVFPLIQVHADKPDEPGRNAPQVGGQGLETDYSLVDEWEGKNPEAVAQQVAGWVDWFDEQFTTHGRGDLRYALWLNGWGAVSHEQEFLHNRRNCWVLGRNPADALDAPISERARVGSWFSAAGVALNREWSSRFCDRLDSELDARNLAAPEALHFDVEGVFDINKIADWWEAALDDPRAEREFIDGEHTLRELARTAPAFWPEYGTHARRNRPFVAWAEGISMRATDNVLWEGFWKQAREHWPEIKLSNFKLTPGTPEMPFFLEKLGMEIDNAKLRHATHAAPTLYPLNDWAFENGRVTVEDHLFRFGARATGHPIVDMNKLSYLVAKRRMDASLASGMRVVPWVRPPNPEKLDLEHTARIIRYGMSRGIDEFILWSDGAYDWSDLIREIDRLGEGLNRGEQ